MKTNGKHEVIARIAGPGLVLAALLVLVLSSSSVGRAQSSATSPVVHAAAPAKAAPAAHPVQPAAAAERRPGGNHEGIKVHGHWIIEVRSPDGTVTARREFENSLITPANSPSASETGSQLLVALLSGIASVYPTAGNWAIQLSSVNNGDTSPCTQPSAFVNQGITGIAGTQAADNCQVTPIVTPAPGTTVRTQTSTSPLAYSSSLPAQMTLAGTVQATQQGTIDTVFTLVAYAIPGGSGFAGVFPFTSLTLGLPAAGTTPATPPVVPVAANQTISVTVTFSFQ